MSSRDDAPEGREDHANDDRRDARKAPLLVPTCVAEKRLLECRETAARCSFGPSRLRQMRSHSPSP
jgi:hypothetical protein